MRGHSTGRSPLGRVLSALRHGRRGRTSALCFVVVLFLFFTLIRDPSSSHDDYDDDASSSVLNDLEYLSLYLEVHLPWTKPKPTSTLHSVDAAQIYEPSNTNRPIVHAPLDAEDGIIDDDIVEPIEVEEHLWDANGLLTVNQRGPHPIYELVRRAEAQWEDKNKRASKTLSQAVHEYRRRYNRLPPTGFDHWWRYVQENNVQLPDEYDLIYRDLEPYWGIDPKILSAAQVHREHFRDSWTIGKVDFDAPASVLNTSLPEGQTENFLKWGAYPQLELLGDQWQYVPPFRATFNPHDAPSQPVEWAWKTAALDAVRRGEYLSRENFPAREGKGYAAMCPPGSPGYESVPSFEELPAPQSNKTFIFDHLASMDVCQHPRLLPLDGIFLSKGNDFDPDRFPTPQFSNSATQMHIDIHAISSYMNDEFAWEDPKWEDKDDDRLVWRGGPTGMKLQEKPGINWRGAHRLRFVNLTSGLMGIEEPISFLRPTSDPSSPVDLPTTRPRGVLNKAMMDVGFSTDYFNCAGDPCEAMESELGRRPHMSQREAGKYKYVFDVDGNGWSARFRRLMSMHSVVFKASVYPEWFSERVQPWVHYVPVQMDYSDLYDSLAFFAGDINGEGAHDEMAKRIGAQGREWVTKYWRKEDMVAYMFRLWLEYARLMSPDRNEMNFELPP